METLQLPPRITVRAATPKDLPAVAKLAGQLVRLHHQLDPERFMLQEPLEEGYRAWLGRELSNSAAVILVAVRTDETLASGNEAVIGYAYGRLEPRDWNALREECGTLHDLFVDPRVRKQGVATELVNAIVRQLAALGAPRVILSTAWSNESAQRLFKQLGFRYTMVEMTREVSTD